MSTANLSWDPASGAVDYKVEYKLSSDSSYTLFNAHNSTTSCVITGLSEGNSYDFRVTTNCSSGSASGVVYTASTPCLDVTDYVASFSGTTANLQWDKKPTAISYAISYKLHSDSVYTTASGSPLSNTGAPDPVLFSISGLTSGAAYDFMVVVNCIDSASSAGEVVSATSTCPNVTTLTATFS